MTENPKEAAGALKCPMQLLSPSAMRETAWALGYGAFNKKYGPRNYRTAGVNATTYVGAIMRHLSAWNDGEDLDPESGLSHIAHVSACCDILLDTMACGMMNDDRSKKPRMTREEILNELRMEDVVARICSEDFAIPEGLYGNPKSMNDPHGVFVEPPKP